MARVERCRDRIRRWYDAGLDCVDPQRAVARELTMQNGRLQVSGSEIPLASDGRLTVIAIGKAAQAMASGAHHVLGDRIDQGVILTKYGHAGAAIPGFELYEAGHPIPDENGLRATQRILGLVAGSGPHDVIICLISGGGSALLELPRHGITLEDMGDITNRLMRTGAGIHDLNTVRRALSQTKGGGLRRAMGSARCVSLLLSDVLGNDPSVIASGPTVIPAYRSNDARRVLERFDLVHTVPTAVHSLLEDEAPYELPDTSRDVVTIVADNGRFVDAIAVSAEEDGYRVLRRDAPFTGDAHDLAHDLCRMIREVPDDIDAVVGGGEATVRVTGSGHGGRNTEMALVAAFQLPEACDWFIASLASDGDDGNAGAAGAIADAATVDRARDAGIDAEAALRDNDSASVFRAAGGIVETGPTGTNVNDVYLAVRCRPSRTEESP